MFNMNRRGFTMIEMIIVIVIIGILSSIVYSNYLNIQKEAKIAAVKGKLAAIRGGIELAHAKIMISGVNTGPSGDNPDWPTVEEVQRNELSLSTRPESLRHLRLVRDLKFATDINKALPTCNLPDMTTGMASNPSAVSQHTLTDIFATPRRADESSCWAYYAGNERDSNGRTVGAVFYLNDDRDHTDNVDSADQRPSAW